MLMPTHTKLLTFCKVPYTSYFEASAPKDPVARSVDLADYTNFCESLAMLEFALELLVWRHYWSRRCPTLLTVKIKATKIRMVYGKKASSKSKIGLYKLDGHELDLLTTYLLVQNNWRRFVAERRILFIQWPCTIPPRLRY